MATTKYLSFPDRIRFALRCYFPNPSDVEKIGAAMKKLDSSCELLDPRPFGKLAREAMGIVWK